MTVSIFPPNKMMFKVDYMLGTFMEELQITPEQFEMACLEGRQNTAAGSAFSFHQGLFQQVYDYETTVYSRFSCSLLSLDLGSK